jgi:hypothetical protein
LTPRAEVSRSVKLYSHSYMMECFTVRKYVMSLTVMEDMVPGSRPL